jgi:hypothetical protein
MDMKEFDGFYFLPGDEDDELKLSYFVLKDEELKGSPIESTEIGDMYHIAFFKENEHGHPEFDDEFEAIFSDPTTYIQHSIVGMNLFGCVFRKTNVSQRWWQDYLIKAKEQCEGLSKKRILSANT